MNLVALVPPGQTELTVNGLHQWDRGRALEIRCNALTAAMLEVHFACAGMTEAIVRSCAVIEGVATVVIPDRCMEQPVPVVAWVYVIDGSVGSTVLTITMPVERRARPAAAPSAPETFTDKYTEAVTAINETVKAAERARDENIADMESLFDKFKTALTAEPTLNRDKRLTEGSGFYYVYLYEDGSPVYCSGLVYWRRGTRSRLATISEYEVGESYYGTYRLDVGVDPDGNLYVYQRSTTKDGVETQKNVTKSWDFYTKKFVG